MSSPISIRNGVGKAENIVLIAIVVLENHISKDIVLGNFTVVIDFDLALAFDDHRLGVNQCFIFPELSHKFLDPFGVVKTLFLSTLWALVFQLDHQARVEEG